MLGLGIIMLFASVLALFAAFDADMDALPNLIVYGLMGFIGSPFLIIGGLRGLSKQSRRRRESRYEDD